MPKFQLSINNDKKLAELKIYGDISSTSWNEEDSTPTNIANQLDQMEGIETLNVRINSYGGDVFAGQAILSLLKRQKCEVIIYIDGIAASAASVIAMAGRCIMPKNAMMMIHNPWSIAIGDSDEMRKTADTLDKIGLAVVEAYKSKAKNLTDQEIKDIMQAESWLTAQECLDYGFCDEIDNQDIEMSINGLKLSPKMFLQQYKNNSKVLKTSNNNQEEKKNMDVLQLCKQVGLNYDQLIKMGLNDDQIKAMALEIKLSQAEKTTQSSTEVNNSASQSVEMSTDNVIEIISLCEKEKMDAKPFIEAKASIETVKASIFDKKQKDMQAIATTNIEVTSESKDKYMNAITDAILLRAGVRLAKPVDGANDFRAMSLKDIAVECAIEMGIKNPSRLSADDLFKMALTPDSQFSSILSNTINKSVSTAYNTANETFSQWVSIGSNPDFKATEHYRVSETGSLQKLPQNGAIQFEELSDQGVTKSLLTYGKGWGITRQALINDDIGILTTTPMRFVRGAIRGVNALVYKYLADTSLTIFDSKALFHSDHGNLATSAAALSVTSLGAGRAAMRTQKDISGNAYLNIKPKFLLVPSALETTADILTGSITDPSNNNPNVKNPFQSLQTICDSELDQYDSNAWYLAGDSMDVDLIEVTYLNGNPSPIVETQVSFERAGMEGRILHDVGVTVLDFKGLYKNAGA